jgi:spore coat polysaccharide biosynthesis predicted glycosyltransferase SpsG
MQVDNLKLILRCDAGEQLGMGHVKRCIALAGWLKEKPAFAMVDTPASVHADVRAAGFESISLGGDPSDQARALAALETDVVVMDIAHKRSRLDPAGMKRQVAALRGLQRPIVFIDGVNTDALVDAELASAVALCVRPYPQARAEAQGDWLIGAEYFIVSPELRQSASEPPPIAQQARKILITTGGGDVGGLTPRILNEFNAISEARLQVRAVLGPLMPERIRHAARKAAANSPHVVELVEDRRDLIADMQWCDLAVATTGLTKYELALYGVPSILISPDDQHEMNNRSFRDCGTALDLGVSDQLKDGAIGEACRSLLQDSQTRRTLSERGRGLVDGMGAARVLTAIKEMTDAR